MSSASAVGEIAVGRFMRCYNGKSRAFGARRFFLLRTQALRPGLNCDAPPALRSGAGRARKPVRLGAGTGVPCPYNGRMRPLGWGKL
jgi:hypothetical protein